MKFTPLQLTRYLFLFTVAILVVFGIGSLLRIDEKPEFTILYVFYAALMFGDAAIMLFCASQLEKRTRLVFYLSVAVLVLNIFPTIFDQFGLVDLLFVILNLATIFAIFTARREFLPA
jgi:predicted membrane channel-forming protein YqfA (hemolysin III family)